MIGHDTEENSLDFGRKNMLRLFQAGRAAQRDGQAWRRPCASMTTDRKGQTACQGHPPKS